MQLKTLEIKGFKSFPERTVIHFNDGITGIVGPNGCGKSNVIDSIRWVLGEQKTGKLRSEKMDNLLFNGTRKRKATSLAEVSLTFENTKNLVASDYQHITITRRLYRSGDSEYRINDVSCRLKDINNLFIDTGVSSDSYAIIELGMIEEILADREHSRRKLFEQAAGISKYKTRKKETLSKLKGTQADLERVEDILHEIDNNLKALESQARKAQRYKKLKTEYKTLSIELSKLEVQALSKKFNALKAEKDKEEDKSRYYEGIVQKEEADLEALKLEILTKEKALTEIQKKLNSLVAGVSSKENERNLLNEQIINNTEKAERATRLLLEADDQELVLNDAIETLIDQRTEAEAALNIATKSVEQLKTEQTEAQNAYNQLKQGLDAEKQTFAQTQQALFTTEKQMAENRTRIEGFQQQLFNASADFESKTEEVEILQENYEIAFEQYLEDKQYLEVLLQKATENKAKKAEIDQKITSCKDAITKENRLLDARQNEYDLTKSLVDNLEGFPESIKFLKKNAKWKKEPPLLVDAIYCPEDYRVAIEKYLEPYLNHYIVLDKEEAVMAINLLNDSGKGRANFFVLEYFNDFEIDEAPIPTGAIRATDILDTDNVYKPLMQSLLKNVVLVDGEANEYEQQDHPDLIFLQKQGKFYLSKHTMGGGAIGLFEGKKIGRAKNLEVLQKEIKSLLTKINRLKQDLTKLENDKKALEQNDQTAVVEQQRQKTNQANTSQATFKSQLEQLQKIVAQHQSQSSSLTTRLTDLKTENTSLTEKSNALNETYKSLESQIAQRDHQFVEFSNRLNEVSSAYNEQNIQYHQRKNRFEQVVQELNFKQQQLNALRKQVTENKTIKTEVQTKIESARQQLKAIEGELLSGYEHKETFEAEVNAAEQAYFKGRNTLNDYEIKIRESKKKVEQSQGLLTAIKDQINTLRIDINSLRDRLKIEFSVDINDLIDAPVESEMDAEEMSARVTRIKQRIDNYGEVNPMAEEAYEEMKTRHEFINTQKQDLLDAENTLLNTIKEIEDTAQAQFLTAFEAIRTNFQQVFRTLFTEDDHCDLILLDPENPLESKIDITAKPKGKRPQVITQLSGGEKTLTATALLFSLYLLKPAPFCIFDEVDAPLDDANIAKFNKIIRKFSADSQFIIVTHNKTTMAHIDVIYGVTMQQEGVSKVVPVDFREKELVEVG